MSKYMVKDHRYERRMEMSQNKDWNLKLSVISWLQGWKRELINIDFYSLDAI